MAAFSYEYRTPGLFRTPAQVAGEIMEQLEQSEQGLSPATLLDASRDANAPLHDEFEWDDAKAAEGYRLNQAGALIRNIRVVITEEQAEQRERAFVNVDYGKGAYVAIASALTNEVWKKNLLEYARRDMSLFQAKYSRLEELAGVISAMQEVL